MDHEQRASPQKENLPRSEQWRLLRYYKPARRAVNTKNGSRAISHPAGQCSELSWRFFAGFPRAGLAAEGVADHQGAEHQEQQK